MVKLTKVEIKDFRIFKDETIYLGSMVTTIAGQNGTGKSILLGLIGNCVEYTRSGQRSETYLKPKKYRTEFGEIFKGSIEHDPSKSNRMVFFFDDNDFRRCRTTWQKYNGKPKSRFRIIPYKDIPETKKRVSSKKEIPAIYLGLSRLFPLGESAKCECSKIKDDEASEWISTQAMKILSMEERDDIHGIDTIKVGETTRKTGVGFKTTRYGPLANSAGQDNIGQILSAVWTIKALKKDLGNNFPGAILLIDEIDATLHPASQIKLLTLLIKEARGLGFQIIFTTHSLSLLREISNKTKCYPENEESNPIELNYLSTGTGSFLCHRNPSYQLIENDLNESSTPFPKKIKAYAEDDEGRWFLRKLLENFSLLARIQLIEGVSMGCDYAIKLCTADPYYFKNVLMVFDGDVEASKMDNHQNLLRLPGYTRPEEVLMDFLIDKDKALEFVAQPGVVEAGLTSRNMNKCKQDIEGQASGDTTGGNKKARELYKEWFNERLPLFEEFHLFEFWIQANPEAANAFICDFKEAFNKIANRLMVPLIT